MHNNTLDLLQEGKNFKNLPQLRNNLYFRNSHHKFLFFGMFGISWIASWDPSVVLIQKFIYSSNFEFFSKFQTIVASECELLPDIFARKNISQVYSFALVSMYYFVQTDKFTCYIVWRYYRGIIFNEICQYFKRLFRNTHHAGHILFSLSQRGLK